MNSTRTRLIVIGLALAATLYFLWPTYRFYRLDAERKAANKDTTTLARWDAANKEAYRNAQSGRIKLGLDLRGGIYITMEVDIPSMLYESAQRDAIDEPFEQVIQATRDEAKLSDEPVIDIFTRNFDKIARPKGKTLLSYFDVGNLGNDVSEEAVVNKLKKNIDDAVNQAEQVVRQRIDRYGVSETSIEKVGGRRLVIELPGASDEAEVRNLLQTTARLEFKPVRNNADAAKAFRHIDEILAGKVSTAKDSTTAAKKDSAHVAKADSANVAKADSTAVAKKDSAKKDSAHIAGNDSGAAHTDTAAKTARGDSAKKNDTSNPYAGLSKDQAIKRYQHDHPFTSLFLSAVQISETAQPQEIDYVSNNLPNGDYFFRVPADKRDQIKRLLARPDVKSIWPEDLIVAFSANPSYTDPKNPDNNIYDMYVITRDPELTGEAITDAYPSFDPQTNKPMVLMQMNADGAETWANITAKSIKKRIAIVLDSAVYSAPVVQNKISGGSSQITGSTDAKEANLLAVVLKAGALKAPVKIIEERIVGPSLGDDSINQGIRATLIAAGLVVIFMLLYYAFGGFVADVAVLFNLLITLAILAAFGATLTLPGIGGLVLTIGMAVDGNVLIYERIREELAAGRSLKSAVDLGYSKAWHALIDTHITTFLTGAILYWFGSGPIQGFAVTLMIGIAATLFTAVFVTRTVFMQMLDRGTTQINFGQPAEGKSATVTA